MQAFLFGKILKYNCAISCFSCKMLQKYTSATRRDRSFILIQLPGTKKILST